MTDNPYDDIEDRAEDRLSHSDYDTELGKRMARDARRVSDGDLSRAAFEEKYLDDVREEFGVDLRDDPNPESEPTPGVPPTESKASRREMLKAAGLLAGGGAVAGAGSSFAGEYVSGSGTAAAQETTEQAGGDSGEDESVQRGMVLDTETCIKCLRCVQACKEENRTPEGHFWMEVHRYQLDDEEYEDPTDCESVQRPCQHCDDAPCIEVCPNNSRFETENGRVLCNYDTCLGCAYCEVACPYHVNSFVHKDPPEYLEDHESSENFEPILEDTTGDFDDEYQYQTHDDEGRWIAGTPPDGSCSKCTFCAHREQDDDLRGTTACEDVCPVSAIQFGDLNDPESAPRQYLDALEDPETKASPVRKAEHSTNTFELRPEASDSNVIYVGDDPSNEEVTEVPGPTTKDDRGLEETDRTLH